MHKVRFVNVVRAQKAKVAIAPASGGEAGVRVGRVVNP